MSLNYAQLVVQIQDYTENTFTTTDINNFIRQAEQRVYNTVQLPALRKNVTGALSSGNKYLAMPPDWLATFSLAVINPANEYTYLLNKDVNFIRQSFPDVDSDFYGEPQYYAVFNDTSFIVGPTPDTNYSAELHYFYYPESIVTAGTSWLGNNFDSVLLYGSLLEAYTYMKGEKDVLDNYRSRYDEAMLLLKQLGDGKNRQDAYRSGQVRYPVQ
jgi:hypothetical protein